MNTRISIRASVYRGRSGFNVNAGAGRNIFCESREQAEAYRDMLRSDISPQAKIRRSYEILCRWSEEPHARRAP